MMRRLATALIFSWLGLASTFAAEPAAPLPGTTPLLMTGDLASNLVSGANQFLSRKLEESVAHRARFWHRDFSSWRAYEQSLATNRQRLAHILGAREQRPRNV